MSWTGRVSLLFAGALVVLCALAPSPSRAGFEERFELAAESLEIHNLIGEVTVKGHAGSSFVIEVEARGSDATRDNLGLDLREGDAASLIIEFPLDRENDYVYPPMGRGSTTSFHRDDSSSGLSRALSMLFGGKSRVRVRGSGRGLELWADVTVLVPEGGRTEIRHGVGTIVAEGVGGDLTLDTRSGSIEATSINGDLLVDTGSGRVIVEDVAGDLTVDTGSGRVELARVRGERVIVDTGSGGIRADAVDARSLTLDTGSGGVTASGISAEDALIDTGSGSVELSFDRIGDGRFEVDTGSGSIRLALPGDASARISADTGGGGIRIDFEGAEIRHLEQDEAELVIGGGEARFVLDTGSGSIRITRSD